VVAAGAPLGLSESVTSGIVSNTARPVRSGSNNDAVYLAVQTDAAINPGNSGGALVDRGGRLVGINTAAARGGTAENIGFAIAIDGARPVIDEIRTQPQARRAWLGAAIASVESDAAAVALGLDPSTRGVRVTEVYEGGPAARAGLEPGDVIVALDGARIRSAEALTRALARLDPGDDVELELIDTAGPRRAEVRLGRPPG
jgi:putative serine protease PepD